METLEEEKKETNKMKEIEQERVEINTHTHTHNSTKWLDRLTIFLYVYAVATFFWACFTNTGVPLLWVLFVLFPCVGIYKLFEWLWK